VLKTFARHEDPVVLELRPESAALIGRIHAVDFPRAKAPGLCCIAASRAKPEH
jgi:hypothetical protein